MAFGGFSENDGGRPMAEINMIPLIDVMLVLLIIFIVTAPLLTHSIKINLPKATTQVNLEKPETVTLSIDASGKLFWDNNQVDDAQLAANLAERGAAQSPARTALARRENHAVSATGRCDVRGAERGRGQDRIYYGTDP